MKITKLLLAVAAAATLVSSTVVQAADPLIDRSDRVFLEKAAKAGLKEVAISETVMAKLTTPAARDFAQSTIADHKAANQELSALAARKGVTLPAPETKFARKWADNDKNVDEDYLKEMVDDHQEAVELYEKAAKSSDPDIAAFAQKTLPTLRQHLETAKIQKKAH
jgi:putative membrane protein